MINYCPKCNRAYNELSKYCSKCAVALEKAPNKCSANSTTYCAHKVYEDDDIACVYCGSPTTYAAEKLTYKQGEFQGRHGHHLQRRRHDH